MKKAKEKMKEKNVQKLFYKTNPMGGISLIVLVITIIIIIILATAVIVSIVGNNPIANARKAVDDSNIKTYTEQIEMIKAKIMLENDEYEFPTIYQIKEKLDKEKWARSTEIIMDEGIEKLKLITKEGYIFYITAEEIEYKGKGKVVDTSALKRDDVIELKAEDKTTNGQNVRITSKAEDYYIVKYKIGEGEKWTEIESGNTVEVPFGETIYAKLFYGNNSGVEFKLKVGETNPTIVASSIDTSNVKRKTDTALANLFDITWGSEGTGTVEYEVTGTLLFDGSNVDCTSKTNTKDFELGTYNVKCTIKNPAGSYEASAQKEVKITTLADTSVESASGSNVNASAIYSEYDLSYFRDLVNGSNQSLNARLIENINLINVCSEQIGSWIPIGDTNVNENINYNGIFEGNDKTIDRLYIQNSSKYQGLFGANNGIIKKLNMENGYINSTSTPIGLLCGLNVGNISNVVTKGESIGFKGVGGIVGINYGTIENSDNYVRVTNNKSVNLADNENSNIGGISGVNRNTIKNCNNYASVSGIRCIGGISGSQYFEDNSYTFLIENCNNYGKIRGEKYVGGIIGYTNMKGTIQNCKNHTDIATTISGGVAGILGFYDGTTDQLYVHSCTNKGKIDSATGASGGIVGAVKTGVDIYACKNEGEVCGKSSAIGGILARDGNDDGIVYSTKIRQCVNKGKVYSSLATEAIRCGGILGYIMEGDNVTINNCYNTGNVEVDTTSTVTEDIGAGGILGCITELNLNTSATITNCYNTGNISNNARPGRAGYIIGYDKNSKRQGGNNYYLDTTSGKDTLAGKPLSDANLKSAASKLGDAWKNDDAKQNNGYPILEWE